MNETLAFALELVALAEAEILPRFRHATVERKADGSEVTQADRAAEQAMRQAIGERFPDDSILGEEFGPEPGINRGRTWIIDPLDGTRWFALGVPLFGTLVALVENGEPVLGVIHLPVSGETVYAQTGHGCWLRTRTDEATRISVSDERRLGHATASASGLHATALEPAPGYASVPLERLIKQVGTFRFCGDCLQHALVCRGVLDVAVDTIMAPWDIAAIVPCIREAGGVVTNLAGVDHDLINGGSLITSANAELHAQAIDALNHRPD